MAFWQSSLEFAKAEIMGFLRNFSSLASCFVRSINATFVVLILKKGGAEDFKDFRLKRVLVKVISESHNAFVEGR